MVQRYMIHEVLTYNGDYIHITSEWARTWILLHPYSDSADNWTSVSLTVAVARAPAVMC